MNVLQATPQQKLQALAYGLLEKLKQNKAFAANYTAYIHPSQKSTTMYFRHTGNKAENFDNR